MHNPSTAQIEANRRNGKHGRGPNTNDGKRKSSQNALRHGLSGRIVVLPTEDMEAYQAFSKELVDSLNPETPMERQLAQTVADSQWRLNRARTWEDGMLALGHSPEIHPALSDAKVFRDHSKDFVNLSLYEQRIQRAQKNAFDQLRELQAERMAKPDPIDTVTGQEMHLSGASVVAKTMTAGQSTPVSANTSEPNGFVCSNREPTDRISSEKPSSSTEFPRPALTFEPGI